jgi:hypothetical protein
MAMRKRLGKVQVAGRASRAKLSAAESLKRMRTFAERKESFNTAIRKGMDRGITA